MDRKTTEEASQSTLYVSTANEVPKSGVSEGAATQTVLDAAKSDPQDLIKPHRDWWHRFYQQSFLSIPDARMESFSGFRFTRWQYVRGLMALLLICLAPFFA